MANGYFQLFALPSLGLFSFVRGVRTYDGREGICVLTLSSVRCGMQCNRSF
jgi:hypothetical protein